MSQFDLESLYKSLIRHVQNTIKVVKAQNISTTLEYYAWDSRGEVQEATTGDLIGLAGWSFKENGGLWEVRAGLTLSTYNDVNLFREVKILNIIHDMWGESSQVAMVDKTTGVEFTQLVVVDFDMLPGGGSAEQRNYRPIGIDLLRTSS
jgi:hypothetical protein